MKKAFKILVFTLLALLSLEPVATLVLAGFGYKLRLSIYPVYSIIIAAVAIAALVFAFALDGKIGSPCSVATAVLPFVATVGGVFIILRSDSSLCTVCMTASFLACFIITAKACDFEAVKIAALVLAVAFAVLAIGFCLLADVFSFGANTVVNSVASPDGKYIAEVIDSDQGALGGDTFIEVKGNCIDLGFATLHKYPERIWEGDWGDWEGMEISWKDNQTLIINSEEYKIR